MVLLNVNGSADTSLKSSRKYMMISSYLYLVFSVFPTTFQLFKNQIYGSIYSFCAPAGPYMNSLILKF